MSNKSGVARQVISLPTGGGAIKGIGETFAPDLHTGTGNFTVPIGLPAGRNGFQPKSDLVYSTGNGNGPFGLGWSLSVPGVSRKTSRGVPRYNDGEDVFLLSGAEDLVPIVADSSGRTRYRPRTEGQFARIVRHHAGPDDYWEVRSRDGLVSLYGTPGQAAHDSATIADPAGGGRVFAWHLTQTRDTFGNRIEYIYERDEIRSDGPHEWDQLYLSTIRYIDYGDPAALQFLVTVRFVYESRPDPFSEYRSGFEIRTVRRCTRIEVRTHAEVERLTRVYHLVYLDQTGIGAEHLPSNGMSLLSRVEVVGHDGDQIERLPPLEFGYTAFDPANQRYQPLAAEGDALPERSLAHPEYELVDLFGHGLPDVIQLNGTVRYWRNLGAGRFDRPRTMAAAPAMAHLADAGVQLADLDGDGHTDLLVTGRERNGYFPLSHEGEWSERGFVPYQTVPSFDLEDPELRLFDIDGDGVTDALRTGPTFQLYYHDGRHGWDRLEVRERQDFDSFPDVSFSDPRVKLADMTGDGLQDIVLIHDGRIDYWPYLGHGRWARRVTMRGSPRFPDGFAYGGVGYDPKRVLLGDVDGDGLADLVYVESGEVTVWLNRGGNGWSDPTTVHGTPPISDLDAARLVDILGTGTAGILWSYDFGTLTDSTYKFLDLTGGVKPYVLQEMNNHMGARTRVEYGASTQYYAADESLPETRWKTHLPFPVQVVARVEVIDDISKGKLTTEYRYHHGYWDGTEREFRGFGMVEQLDTETFSDYHSTGVHGPGTRFEPVAEKHFSPPLLTRNWFHQGPVDQERGDWRELDWSDEYWPGDPPALAHAETINAFLGTLADPGHRRDALRTLRGSILRTELYALDGTARQDRPYTVTEQVYGLREESIPDASDGQRGRIFFPHQVAQRTTQWERGAEPMTQFAWTDAYDSYGQSCQQVSLAVPRHRDYRAPGPAGEPYLGVLAETTYAQRDDEQRYIVDRIAGSTSFEMLNDGSQAILDVYRQIREDSAARRVIGQSFNYYDGDAFEGLPFGQLGDFGAVVRTETLAMTEELLHEAYRDPADPDAPTMPPYLRPERASSWPAEYPQEFRESTPALAGYTFADGDHRVRGYFAQSSRVAFDFQAPASTNPRGLPVTMRDPLESDTTIAHDAFQLFPLMVTNAVGLATSAEYDYRVLQPRLVFDPNGNRQVATFNPLGLVTATAVMGKEEEQVGDTLDAPSARLEYDFLAFVDRQQPVSVRSIARQHHVTDTDMPLPEREETIETVQYSDGFGRLLQTRAQAEDVLFGDASFGGGVLPSDQSIATGDAIGRRRAESGPPNVIVSGWQIYNNKGRVVEKYEPYFTVGWDYATAGASQLGQKATMFYDPRGQVIRQVNPDGSEQRMIYGLPVNLNDPDVFTPTLWEAFTYDANDNAGRTHAADSAAYQHHWNTPGSITVDALGRTIEAIARNGSDSEAHWYKTQSSYDIRGNVVAVTDALGRVAFSYTYDLGNRAWRIESIDAGLRRIVLNVLGNEIERRDSKGALVLQTYDRLHRPSRFWASDHAGSAVTLRQRMDYGDAGRPDQSAPERAAMRSGNLLGQLHRHHDEAGLLVMEALDFKGNVLEKARRVIADASILQVFENAAANDWSVEAFRVDWSLGSGESLADRETALLDAAEYRTSVLYDALNRIKVMRYPQDVEGQRKTLRPQYNRARALERVTLDGTIYVERLAYDAKGQRSLIAYGNGLMARYAYDPHRFRLARLRSERYTKPDDLTYRPSGPALQDLGYRYDLAGNILSIVDCAPESGIINNPQAAGETDSQLALMLASGNALIHRFDYDPIYRLTSATGRECDLPPDGPPWLDLPRCTDLTRTRAYVERYQYDAMGNILRLRHQNEPGGFTRVFAVEDQNNRLKTLTIGDTVFSYEHDANGNMVAETSSRHFEWNHSDQLKAFRTQTVGAEPSVHAHYLYDAAGQRAKKVVRKQGGRVEVTSYIDGVFEIHRVVHGAETHENNTLHVMDDQSRVALIRVGPALPDDSAPAVTYHLGDHLGSSNVVVGDDGNWINREEFTPYGETSFGSVAKKRYRFTGKERDEETGLNYHDARYYLPWLNRWASVDLMGAQVPGLNPYAYAALNPLVFLDQSGRQAELTNEQKAVIDNIERWGKEAESFASTHGDVERQYWRAQKAIEDAADALRDRGVPRAGLDAGLKLEYPGEYAEFERVKPIYEQWERQLARGATLREGLRTFPREVGFRDTPWRVLLSDKLDIGQDALRRGGGGAPPAPSGPRLGGSPPTPPPPARGGFGASFKGGLKTVGSIGRGIIVGWITGQISADILYSGVDVSEERRSEAAEVASTAPPGVNILAALLARGYAEVWRGMLESVYFYSPEDIRQHRESTGRTYGQTLRDFQEADQASRDFIQGDW